MKLSGINIIIIIFCIVIIALLLYQVMSTKSKTDDLKREVLDLKDVIKDRDEIISRLQRNKDEETMIHGSDFFGGAEPIEVYNNQNEIYSSDAEAIEVNNEQTEEVFEVTSMGEVPITDSIVSSVSVTATVTETESLPPKTQNESQKDKMMALSMPELKLLAKEFKVPVTVKKKPKTREQLIDDILSKQ
jgi:hypothetical protein